MEFVRKMQMMKHRFAPASRACRICKQKVPGDMHYCIGCAHHKGICTRCGRKILDTSSYASHIGDTPGMKKGLGGSGKSGGSGSKASSKSKEAGGGSWKDFKVAGPKKPSGPRRK